MSPPGPTRKRWPCGPVGQRDDRALERPPNLTGGSAGKVVAKLLIEGLVEEIQSRGLLPVWRRNGEDAHTLRITKRGLRAIRVDDEATAAAADKLPNLRRFQVEGQLDLCGKLALRNVC